MGMEGVCLLGGLGRGLEGGTREPELIVSLLCSCVVFFSFLAHLFLLVLLGRWLFVLCWL